MIKKNISKSIVKRFFSRKASKSYIDLSKNVISFIESEKDKMNNSELILSIPQANGFIPPLFYTNETYKKGSSKGFILIKQAYLAFKHSAEQIGWQVTAESPKALEKTSKVVALNWSAKVDHGKKDEQLFIEHGWLPRWTYQISFKGSNSSSHIAESFSYRSINELNQEKLAEQIKKVRLMFEAQLENTKNELNTAFLPPEFILVAFQLANDANLRDSNCELSNLYTHDENGNLRFAEALRDLVYAENPDLPVVFKQHPVDKTDLSKMKIRPNDLLITNNQNINTNQIFSTGKCKLVISINSNTLHEASIWGVFGVSLGTLVWDEFNVKNRPYCNKIGDALIKINSGDTDDPYLKLYLQHLFENQWTVDDLLNPYKVKRLLESHQDGYVPNPFNTEC